MEALNLIKSLLSWYPNSRPTARKALQHPFFIPCHNTNTPIPPPILQSVYHSEVREQKPPYNDNGEHVFLSNPYSVWQQILNSMPQFNPPYTVKKSIVKPFPVRTTLQINPMAEQQMRVTTETPGSDPLSFSSAYAIWRQIA
jgi:serine/threonine protein kinase